MNKSIIIIGYSGHAFVICDIFKSAGRKVMGYCENESKDFNPYQLSFYGSERSEDGLNVLKQNDYFIAIGSNLIRRKVHDFLQEQEVRLPTNAIHSSSVISSSSTLGQGVMISANVSINPLATIGNGVICNTGCVIEHENKIRDFAHIGPGAVLCGNVIVGENSFIGANAVIKQGVKIGANVMIGAGTVVIKDIPSNATVVGNPQRKIK